MANNLNLAFSVYSPQIRDELLDKLRAGTLAILAGSGISNPDPSRLPLWKGLLEEMVRYWTKDRFKDFWNYEMSFHHATLTLRAFLDHALAEIADETLSLETISALQRGLFQIDALDASLDLREQYYECFQEVFSTNQYNENHELIVATNFRQILTINYDTLLEAAAEANGYLYESFSSYDTAAAEIAAFVQTEEPMIWHIHGKADSADIVVTRDDYMRLRPVGDSITQSVLAYIFTNYSILFIGYGGVDPTIERLRNDYIRSLHISSRDDLPDHYFLMRRDEIVFGRTAHEAQNLTKMVYWETPADVTAFLRMLSAVKRPQH